MGQGASTPQAPNDREAGEPGHQDAGNESDGRERVSSGITVLRRSRRIRDGLTMFRERLLRTAQPPTMPHSSTTTTPSVSNRTRNSRVRRAPITVRTSPPAVGAHRSTRHPASGSNLPSSPLSPWRAGEEESDTLMSNSINSVSGPQSLDFDPSPIPSQPPMPRRSRMSRVRSSISTTLPNLLAEIGSPRHSLHSRRDSQLLRSFSPFHEHDDELMDLDRSTIGTSPSESSLRPHRPDFASLSDPSGMDLLENPRVRPGEDQAAMLSRLLSVAAAMTAASLVGSSEQALTEAQDVAGGDGVDGSFESFLRALQNGRLAAALRNGGNEMGGGVPAEPGSDGALAPLNFFRMFRFGAGPSTSQESADLPPARMVPVIIVGIRSVTPRESPPTESATGPGSPFIEQLANMSANRPEGSRLRTGSGSRRASTGAVGSDRLRSPRRSLRPDTLFPETLFPMPSSIPDTPQGPYPPPSTPADHGLPNFTPRVPNPTGNAAEASASGTRGDRRSSPPILARDGLHSPEDPQATAGSSNGSSSTNQRRQGEGTRSWIIYVLGGSYPENHPILTTPSLFTDTPTYEDMMLLSSLLGPAKPPVASREDIDSAGGIFIVRDPLSSVNDKNSRQLPDGDKCLVCLSEYETGEECRSLTQCNHVFHKECIDTWLTTGRNSCPLCRGRGVEEKEVPPQPPNPVDTVT
ncbi:hypothetical protein DFH27DRAFT_487773 [Peziza echinospora]|nr:hypothetical protein DFH27DRAFT_487773 [Peziza echinospora]